MKSWEIIADNLNDAGWSLGWVSALDFEGRTIWIVDAHGYGKRFVVRADEKLTTLIERQGGDSGRLAVTSPPKRAVTYPKALDELLSK